MEAENAAKTKSSQWVSTSPQTAVGDTGAAHARAARPNSASLYSAARFRRLTSERAHFRKGSKVMYGGVRVRVRACRVVADFVRAQCLRRSYISRASTVRAQVFMSERIPPLRQLRNLPQWEGGKRVDTAGRVWRGGGSGGIPSWGNVKETTCLLCHMKQWGKHALHHPKQKLVPHWIVFQQNIREGGREGQRQGASEGWGLGGLGVIWL